MREEVRCGTMGEAVCCGRVREVVCCGRVREAVCCGRVRASVCCGRLDRRISFAGEARDAASDSSDASGAEANEPVHHREGFSLLQQW